MKDIAVDTDVAGLHFYPGGVEDISRGLRAYSPDTPGKSYRFTLDLGGVAEVLLATFVIALIGTAPMPVHAVEDTPPEAVALSAKEVESRFDKILGKLWDNDEAVRKASLDELRELSGAKKTPNPNVGVKALRAALRPYAFEKPKGPEISNDLVAYAESGPLPEYIPVILELFDKYDDETKELAQRILNQIGSVEAAEALMTLVRTHAPVQKLPTLSIYSFESKPRYTKTFFPELFKYVGDARLSFDIYGLCLAHCQAKLLTSAELAPFSDEAVRTYRDDVKKLHQIQSNLEIYKKLDEEIADATAKKDFKRTSELERKKSDKEHEDRQAYDEAGLLLDLFRYFPAERVEKVLREALELKDAALRFFAVESLMELNKPVDQKHLDYVAANPEARTMLLEYLQKNDKIALFPKQFLTQAAFAESEMVNWLKFPTELGKAPDEIELMKVVPIDTGLPDKIYDYYVFRFRTFPPHWAAKDGWTAGVSGPFLRGSTSNVSLGDTFSTFKKWGERTPEELVGDTKDLIKRWREHELKKKEKDE